MNQKNIFTIISAVLLLQGIAFYLMGDKIIASSFTNLDEAGKNAGVILMQVISVTSIIVGLIAFASRNSPDVLWAFTVGFILFLAVSSKHLFLDHVNVPIPAMIIQLLIVLSCGYLWMQNKNA